MFTRNVLALAWYWSCNHCVLFIKVDNNHDDMRTSTLCHTNAHLCGNWHWLISEHGKASIINNATRGGRVVNINHAQKDAWQRCVMSWHLTFSVLRALIRISHISRHRHTSFLLGAGTCEDANLATVHSAKIDIHSSILLQIRIISLPLCPRLLPVTLVSSFSNVSLPFVPCCSWQLVHLLR